MINKVLFDNDILIQTKIHLLPIMYAIINCIYLIEVLLLLNYVNSSINLGQGIIYDRVIIFYNIVIITLFIFVYLITPIFSSGCITNLFNNNKLINLIVSGISSKDIVKEKFALSIMNASYCIIAALPIGYVSLFFGGIHIIKILKILLVLFLYLVLYNMICIMISSYNNNILVSYIISYFAGIPLIIIILFLLNTLVSNIIAFIIYIIMTVFIMFIMYLFAIEGSNFKNV